MKPKITIVTVCLNARDDLKETLESVKKQKTKSIEYIVLDGGSIDGTNELVRECKGIIDLYRSEKDGGVYNAMNKGVDLANGEYIIFMNAGDKFEDDVINALVAVINKSEPDVLYGDLMVGEKKIGAKKFNKINLSIWGTRCLCHQSILVKKKITPKYLEDYKIKAELAWYFDVLKNMKSAIYVPLAICTYKGGGISEKYFKQEVIETIMVMKKKSYFFGLLHFPILIYKVLRRMI